MRPSYSGCSPGNWQNRTAGLRQRSGKTIPEGEIDRSNEAEPRPKVIQFEGFFEVKDGEGNKDTERDDLLEDLELTDGEDGVTDPIGRDVKEVFEKGNPPAEEGGEEPGTIFEISKVGVPGEGHENIAANEEQNSEGNGRHRSTMDFLKTTLKSSVSLYAAGWRPDGLTGVRGPCHPRLVGRTFR